MASLTPTMELSKNQAQAIANELGIDLPTKINGWKRVGNLRLSKIPTFFRKCANSSSYRLTAPTPDELKAFFTIAGNNGKKVCITYKIEKKG